MKHVECTCEMSHPLSMEWLYCNNYRVGNILFQILEEYSEIKILALKLCAYNSVMVREDLALNDFSLGTCEMGEVVQFVIKIISVSV